MKSNITLTDPDHHRLAGDPEPAGSSFGWAMAEMLGQAK